MNHLPSTLIKISEDLAKDRLTPVLRARLLAAEHHFKGKEWFWMWVPLLEWAYVSEEHRIICLKTTNGQPIDLDGVHTQSMELKWIEYTEYRRPRFWSFNYEQYQGGSSAS